MKLHDRVYRRACWRLVKMKNAQNENVKVPISEKLSYASGQGGSVVLSALLSSFIMSYYTDTVLISAAAIGTMFLIARVFDGISDVIIGALVDKTNTRFGKARPWILAAAPLMAIALVLMFCINTNWSDSGKLIYAYITYIFANVIAYTIFNIAHFALLAKMTMDVQDRTNTTTVAMIVNNIVMMIVGGVFTPLVMKFGWRNAAICMGVLSGVLIFVEFLGTRERVAVEENTEAKADEIPLGEAVRSLFRNKYFILMLLLNLLILLMNANSIQAMIYYCNYVLGNPLYISALLSIGNIPSLVAMFLIPGLSKKFSKQKVMLGSAALLVVSFAILGLAGSNYYVIMAGVILKNVAVSPMFALPMAMTADIVDYNEYKTGFRSIGLINSGSSVGAKIGIGLGSAMTGFILAIAGYDGAAAVQTGTAISGIKFAFSWSGLILSVGILLVVLGLDIEKKLPEIQKALAERHAKY